MTLHEKHFNWTEQHKTQLSNSYNQFVFSVDLPHHNFANLTPYYTATVIKQN